MKILLLAVFYTVLLNYSLNQAKTIVKRDSGDYFYDDDDENENSNGTILKTENEDLIKSEVIEKPEELPSLLEVDEQLPQVDAILLADVNTTEADFNYDDPNKNQDVVDNVTEKNDETEDEDQYDFQDYKEDEEEEEDTVSTSKATKIIEPIIVRTKPPQAVAEKIQPTFTPISEENNSNNTETEFNKLYIIMPVAGLLVVVLIIAAFLIFKKTSKSKKDSAASGEAKRSPIYRQVPTTDIANQI